MKKTGLLFLCEVELLEPFDGVIYEVYRDLETGTKIAFENGLTSISGK